MCKVVALTNFVISSFFVFLIGFTFYDYAGSVLYMRVLKALRDITPELSCVDGM